MCLLLCFQARAFSFPMMGSKTEPRIARIINSDSDRFPLPGAWKISGWHYTDLDIFVYLEKARGKTALVRLANSSLKSNGLLIGESRNFRVEIVSFSGVDIKEAERAGRALLERIKQNEPAMFFDYPDMKNRETMSEYIFRKYFFQFLLISGLASSVALFILSFPVIRKQLLPSGPAAAALLLCMIAGGALIRFTAGPQAPIHNNGHGVRQLRALLYMESPEQKEIKYGRTYIAIMGPLAAAAGGTDKSVFLLNEIFGALAILCMYMMARALLKSEAAALTAAAAFCFSPALVWLSGSESPVSMHIFFALAGFAFAAVSARSRSVSILWLSCIFICIAASMRMLTILVAPAAGLIFLCSYYSSSSSSPTERPARKITDNYFSNTFHKHALFCLGVIALWVSFHWLSVDPENAGKGFARFSPTVFINTMRHYNILFDPTLTSACLPVFAAAGFLITAWKRPLLAATTAAIFVLLVPISFTTMADRTDLVRYQPQAHWLYFLFAGALADFFATIRLHRALALAAAISIPVAIASFSMNGLEFLASGNEETAEYHFIKKAASEMRPGSRIVLPESGAAGRGRLSAEFPDYFGKFLLERGRPGGTDRESIIYRGLDCYRYGDVEEIQQKSARGGMTQECASVCGGRTAPIMEKTLEAKIPAGNFHSRYFLLGANRPVIGFYKCPGSGRQRN
ncbi:MAG: hypothetical protein WCX65_07080 [bacterium]